MKNFYTKEVLGWGFLLWLIGYILGFVFFAIAPAGMIGWYVMPFGIVITLAVLWKKIHLASLTDAFIVGIGWSLIAIVCDYLFLVLLLKPADGYYKLDVYLYYLFTLALPLLVYGMKGRK